MNGYTFKEVKFNSCLKKRNEFGPSNFILFYFFRVDPFSKKKKKKKKKKKE